MGETVRFHSSQGPFGFLSNLASYPMDVDGREWPSVEHYFQAQKFSGTEHEEKIRNAASPAGATRMGRSSERPLPEDWEDVKEDVMRRALEAKFGQHDELRERLLSTADALLLSATKGDDCWGVGDDEKGDNRLGILLMEIRADFRARVAGPYIETLSAVLKGGSRSWVLFRHGTCVVLLGSNPTLDLRDAATELLTQHGPSSPGSSSGDFSVLELTGGQGWAVGCSHPDILTLVLSSEARAGASHLAVGVIGREKRNRDALSRLAIHVEDARQEDD